jgi:hypothetical protein
MVCVSQRCRCIDKRNAVTIPCSDPCFKQLISDNLLKILQGFFSLSCPIIHEASNNQSTLLVFRPSPFIFYLFSFFFHCFQETGMRAFASRTSNSPPSRFRALESWKLIVALIIDKKPYGGEFSRLWLGLKGQSGEEGMGGPDR